MNADDATHNDQKCDKEADDFPGCNGIVPVFAYDDRCPYPATQCDNKYDGESTGCTN
jgi:hypothetical protein